MDVGCPKSALPKHITWRAGLLACTQQSSGERDGLPFQRFKSPEERFCILEGFGRLLRSHLVAVSP